jgi:cysteinyl-tRNA synthetase
MITATRKSRNFVKKIRGLHDVRINNSLASNPSARLDFLLPSLPDSSLSDTSSSQTKFPRTLNWYSCGPTVYDDAHLGHARTYVCTDIIRRILEDFFHVPVNFALGITDVDDKIIARARAAGRADSWKEMIQFARPFEESFFRDMDALGVQRPNAILRVSDHMSNIENYVNLLRKHGSAYDVSGEGVYFDTLSAPDYGKLGGLPPLPNPNTSSKNSVPADVRKADDVDTTHHDPQLPGVAYEDVSEPLVGKRHFRDFSLWKCAKPNEPFYESNILGNGRPGWHIECSAMTESYFGSSFDVHSGGIDLRFPHHTNEIAQAEAHARACGTGGAALALAPPQDWVRIWLHTGHLYIQGLKMSKSLKNFISVGQFLRESASPYPATDFRIFCLQHKYSSSLHFSADRIREAGSYRDRLTLLLDLSALAGTSSVQHTKPTAESIQLTQQLLKCQEGMRSHLASDFNTPAALNDISTLVGKAIEYAQRMLGKNSSSSSSSSTAAVPLPSEQPVGPLVNTAKWVAGVFTLFGVDIPNSSASSTGGAGSGGARAGGVAEMEALVAFRARVRTAALSGIQAKDGSVARAVLAACDSFRDEEAPRLGYTLRDVGGVSTYGRAGKGSGPAKE